MKLMILSLVSLILYTSSLCSAYIQPLCHSNERTALLQFKLSFSIAKFASHDPFAYPKTNSWKSIGNQSDCCSWAGIECNKRSGHITNLDLSSSYLYGFITYNSTIFDLVYLQKLNLADNDFRYSLIVSRIGRLTNLKYLNLSMSHFFGQVPIEISTLRKLISLDLSNNELRMREPNFRTLVQNLTALKMIDLSGVDISSQIPEIFANFTSLTHLSLQDCGLQGVFPKGIFFLPNLQLLKVRDNENLVGCLPEFHNSSRLVELFLCNTGFSGNVPASIGNLGFLTILDLLNCNLTGPIPYSLGKLSKLTFASLGGNLFGGQIPNSLANLTQLEYLSVENCHLTGEIPASLANLTKLAYLSLVANKLHGSIPSSITRCMNLKYLDLSMNNFANPLDFNPFLELKQLQALQLSDVDLIFPKQNHNNLTYPQFVVLLLDNCNLTQVPDFLHNQTRLRGLFITRNQIQGPLPVPSQSLLIFDLSHNAFNGEIPTSICNATSLVGLSLEDNEFSGRIPPCIFNLSNYLSLLRIRQNNLQGSIPETFTRKCTLEMLNLGDNQLQGKVPRSLTNCSSLAVLDLGQNLIDDTFPSWLATLPKLQALALGSNRLHGALPRELGSSFPSLHILDLSSNKLTGTLSEVLFLNLHSMVAESEQRQYTVFTPIIRVSGKTIYYFYRYSVATLYKGRETYLYDHVNIFNIVDLSNNGFVGNFPNAIANLVRLQALNLSHNNFTGSIPQSFANLSNLEALDLSCNLLSGQIPHQLTKLTFLEILNVSYNHLTGTIPQGNQFSTFGNDSFEGNIGLCGSPLSIKCENSQHQSLPPPQAQHHSDDGEDEESSSLVDWIIISMGYASGVVVGVILGHIFTRQKHEWFVETVGRRRQHNKRRA